MRIIIAFDSMKGCITSAEANAAAAEGVHAAFPDAEVVSLTMSDGGDGMLDAFSCAIKAERRTITVHDPLMRLISAEFAITDDGTAVIEMARASGLSLLTEQEFNPWEASSAGTGEMIAEAVRLGCNHIIIGLGGSATSDAGKGLLDALSNAFPIIEGRTSPLQITIASDVENPLCGPQGAAYVFARQKGAKSIGEIEKIDKRAQLLAEQKKAETGIDYSHYPGAGAAGGCGFALLALQSLCKGKVEVQMESGAELLLQMLQFDKLLANSTIVITGEGSSDRQTLMGKLPMHILRHAQQQNVPVALLSGQIHEKETLLSAGFARTESFNPPSLPLNEAIKPSVAKHNISVFCTNVFCAMHV